MKKPSCLRNYLALLLFLALVLAPAWALADPDAAWLREHNAQRAALNNTGMYVLGGWAVLNITAGAIGWASSEDLRWRSLHQMNLGWNLINLGLATAGILGGLGEDPGAFDLAATIQEGAFLQKLYLFNAGLDLAYMAGGAFLWERGLRKADDRFVGFGQSVIAQGAFLFVFDLAMFILHQGQQGEIYPVLGAAPNSVGLGMLW